MRRRGEFRTEALRRLGPTKYKEVMVSLRSLIAHDLYYYGGVEVDVRHFKRKWGLSQAEVDAVVALEKDRRERHHARMEHGDERQHYDSTPEYIYSDEYDDDGEWYARLTGINNPHHANIEREHLRRRGRRA